MTSSRKFQTSFWNEPRGTRVFDSTSGVAPSWHISTLIPARNEETLLPRCLTSILSARQRLPVHVTSDIVVVDDGSSDRTRAIAEKLLGQHGVVVSMADGVVGKARALAASLALARHSGSPHLHWLANTDADCCVPDSWLLDHLALAATNVEAVAGIVGVDSFSEHGPEVAERFHSSYLIHADGTHPHVHGANLGVRADAYLRAGGWGPLPTAEDHDLWNRLNRTGSRCASLESLKVLTSGRRFARAPLGFAQALAAHNTQQFEVGA